MILFFPWKTFIQVNSRHYASSHAFVHSDNLLQFLHFSINLKSLQLTRECHAQILSVGYDQNAYFAAKLISAYSTCGDTLHSQIVFNKIRHKNVYLWNALINGFAKNHLVNEVFCLFKKMCKSNEYPDEFTLSTVSKLSSEHKELLQGKTIHCKSVRTGLVLDTVLANSIMSMYCKCEEYFESRKLFDEMPHRSVASWNVLICAFAVLGDYRLNEAILDLVRYMQIEGLKPDAFTISTLLPFCGADDGKYVYGRELHCHVLKNNLNSDSYTDVHLGCCLIDMYSKSDKIIFARRVFDRLERGNVFSWTSMINGYERNGDSSEAFNLFRKMQLRYKIEPNRVSLITVLPACSSLAGLLYGKQVHGFAIRKQMNDEVSLCNALIDMYSKCGSLNYARQLFEDGSFCNDSITWSSMISGYGLHGNGDEAILLYDQMLHAGMKPDVITVVGVLSACGKAGLVSKGLEIYNSVIKDYGIYPTVEISACVVDMLSRSGQLDRALHFIKAMPVEAGPSLWGALLSGSIIHGNSKLRDLAYEFLIKVEPENPSNYVSLSNFHAASMKWDFVAEMRKMMKERGFKKLPGCSWIYINGKTHCFYVTDKLHPCSNFIYEMLDDLVLAMKGPFSPSDF